MIGLLIVAGELVRGTHRKSPPSRDAMANARDGRVPRKVNGLWSMVRGPRPGRGEPR